MCGIAGIYDLNGDRSIDRGALQNMADAIAHRGPDGEGFFRGPGVGFAHRRLAIIDIDGGAQPFHASNNQGVLTFNGEIYNYRALKAEVAGSSGNIRTNSDTEILAEGLTLNGRDYIHKLRACLRLDIGAPPTGPFCSGATAWEKSRSTTR